jgi:hypothetical protein
VSDATTSIELLPISIIQSQPALLEGEAKAKRLEYLASLSDADLRDEVRAGVISFP